MPKKVLWRLLIWFVLMGYMALDFLVFKGPLHQKLREGKEQQAPDTERGIAARVFNKPIYLSQIDFAVDKMLWAKGRKRDSVSDSELVYLRQVALRDLADQYILRTKLREQMDKYPVSDAEVSAAVQRFASRFSNKEEMVAALKASGIQGDKELRFRLAAKLQQDQYIQKFIKPDPKLIEEEAKKTYELYKAQASIPERVQVYQIFCAKLENSEAEALAKLHLSLACLNLSMERQSVFEVLAEAFSEDERSKRVGGNLGWLRKGRVAADFTDQVFAAELNTPKIIATKLGWHLILVTEKKAKELRDYADMKDEIILALETHQRKNNVEKFRISLRKQQADKIRIDWEMLKRPWTEKAKSE